MNKMIFVAALMLTACSPKQDKLPDNKIGNLQNIVQPVPTADNATTAADNATTTADNYDSEIDTEIGLDREKASDEKWAPYGLRNHTAVENENFKLLAQNEILCQVHRHTAPGPDKFCTIQAERLAGITADDDDYMDQTLKDLHNDAARH